MKCRSIPALCCGLLGMVALISRPVVAGAQVSISAYEFTSVAVDYAPSSSNPDYSLQGSLGQSVVTTNAPTNTGQLLAYLGFGETAVRFRYLGLVQLDAYQANAADVPLSVRLYNTDGMLTDETLVSQDSDGDYAVDSWLNPAFAARLSVKAPHWLRRPVVITPPTDSLTYPTASTALLVNGDANDDNSVDVFDFFALSDSYNLSVGQDGFDPMADFNGDGTVDVFDFFILADSYNMIGDE